MKITTPGLTLITAGMSGGKSHLVKYIIYALKSKVKYGIVFSHTAFNEGNFNYIPKEYIFAEYKPEIVKNLMNIQEKISKKKRPLAFIILDDCVFDVWSKCVYFNRLITQVRHYNVLIIITTQYVNKIPVLIRENAFQICIFASDTKRSLEALYESYGQNFETFNEFKQYIMNNTGDHKFIFYDKKAKKKDNLYSIKKAPAKIPTFKLNY